MPKRIRKTPEPDFNQLAQYLVQRSTEEPADPTPLRDTPEEQMRQVMREMGRRGGKKGGAVRASRMTSDQRSSAASVAAQARWKKEPTD